MAVNTPEATVNTFEGRLYARAPAKAGKFHDYFTSCLPSPLKSEPVEISLTGNAPIRLGDEHGVAIPSLETGVGPEMVSRLSQSQEALAFRFLVPVLPWQHQSC